MKIQILAAIAGLALAAAPANAVITSIVLGGGTSVGVTSSVIAAPGNVQTLSGPTFYGFTEVADILTTPLRPQILPAPNFPNTSVLVPTGVRVSSHFFVFAPTSTQTVTGTITFNQNIIGLQRTFGAINAARSLQIRAPGTSYALTSNQGTDGGDTFTFVNSKTLNFSMTATSANKDMFSIITAVPEPATWAMLLVGFGLVGLARRRQVRTVAA
ncbi:PEPxxWA-CTERM sorting domain-containing protein [Sandarakinorhabdus sp.]|jgi:hypothetical protein|uniref:PEPxxWA-CTERM sorting domain-containing protein n=1 Tax=Sandarakinorhabdus sp. TaxID=1916663 RepID=UPI00333ED79C